MKWIKVGIYVIKEESIVAIFKSQDSFIVILLQGTEPIRIGAVSESRADAEILLEKFSSNARPVSAEDKWEAS